MVDCIRSIRCEESIIPNISVTLHEMKDRRIELCSRVKNCFFLPRDVCLAIVKSEEWKLALLNETMNDRSMRTTPMRKLIRKMPGLSTIDIEFSFRNLLGCLHGWTENSDSVLQQVTLRIFNSLLNIYGNTLNI